MATAAAGSPELTQDELLRHYRVMRTIREFEERVHREFATGDIPGFVHLYAGEEAIAAGVCACLRDDDYITSTHRGHGHAIAKGCDVDAMMAEIFGRRTGLSKGKGGSMHIADLGLGMLGANGIVAEARRSSAASGLSAKIRGTDQVGVTFAGDGALQPGHVPGEPQPGGDLERELSSSWSRTTATPSRRRVDLPPGRHRRGQARRRLRHARASAVDGSDFFAVHEAAGEAVARARSGGGPTLLECKTVRFFGHFEGDAQTYRGENEIEDAAREPRLR